MDDLFDIEGERDSKRTGRLAYRPACGITCMRSQDSLNSQMRLDSINQMEYAFVLDTPTQRQDREGIPMTGTFNRIWDAWCKEYGKEDPLSNTGVAYAVACYSPVALDSYSSSDYSIALSSCHGQLADFLSSSDKLKVVFLLGKGAWDSVFSDKVIGRMSSVAWTDFQFHFIPNSDYGHEVLFVPMPSAAYLAGLCKERRTEPDYDFYMRRIHAFFREALDMNVSSRAVKAPSTVICNTRDEACLALSAFLADRPGMLSFDYETDALKLERDDRGIVMVGLSDGWRTVSMPFFKEDKAWMSLFTALMSDESIGKIAHHAKFESRCTMDEVGVLPAPWAWDSMYGARMLKNNEPCQLKFQVFVNFGISGYDTMEEYLSPSAENAAAMASNACNGLRSAVNGSPELMERALRYVADDAYYTYRLAERQMPLVNGDAHLKKGMELFLKSINPLVKTELRGMPVDINGINETIAICEARIAGVEERISSDPFVAQNWKLSRPFDYRKADLGQLLYEFGGVKEARTKKGAWDVSEEMLESLHMPLTDNILTARKLAKLKDTYLQGLRSESVPIKGAALSAVYPFFHLHTADTFRSSASAPNFQNIPVRSEMSTKFIRANIKPRPGFCIMGFDYKAMEVSAGCSIHHDGNMTSFLESNGDMHAASAKAMGLFTDAEWETTNKELRKTIRQTAKRFNFASFYGSYYKQTAPTAWNTIKKHPELLEHLKVKGIMDYADFEEHMKEVDRNLWEVQFPRYAEWRNETYDFYLKHGYVDLVTGFRCHGPLSRNQSTNAPIQGPAFHCLLWTFDHVSNELAERGMKSGIMGQIHDCLVIEAAADEMDEVKRIVRKYGVDGIKSDPQFQWLCTPLAMELEFSKTYEEGGNWADMEEGGFI